MTEQTKNELRAALRHELQHPRALNADRLTVQEARSAIYESALKIDDESPCDGSSDAEQYLATLLLWGGWER